MGQVYVLVSRVTDPKNFSLVGIPPRDLVEDLAQALLRAGIDVDSFFEKACQVSGEWKYDRSRARVLDRIQQKFSNERTVPLRFRTLGICFILVTKGRSVRQYFPDLVHLESCPYSSAPLQSALEAGVSLIGGRL